MAIDWQAGIKEINEGTEGYVSGAQNLQRSMSEYGQVIGAKKRQEFQDIVQGAQGIAQGLKQYKQADIDKQEFDLKLRNMNQEYNIRAEQESRSQVDFNNSSEERLASLKMREDKKKADLSTIQNLGLSFDTTKDGDPSAYLANHYTQKKDARDDVANNIAKRRQGLEEQKFAQEKVNDETKRVADFAKSNPIMRNQANLGTNYQNTYQNVDPDLKPLAQKNAEIFDAKFVPKAQSVIKTNQLLREISEAVEPGFKSKNADGTMSDTDTTYISNKMIALFASSDPADQKKAQTIQQKLNRNLMADKDAIIGTGAVSNPEREVMAESNSGNLPPPGSNFWKNALNSENGFFRNLAQVMAKEDNANLRFGAFLNIQNSNLRQNKTDLQNMDSENQSFAFVPKEKYNSIVTQLSPNAVVNAQAIATDSRDKTLQTAFNNPNLTAHPSAVAMDNQAENNRTMNFDNIENPELRKSLTTPAAIAQYDATMGVIRQKVKLIQVKNTYSMPAKDADLSKSFEKDGRGNVIDSAAGSVFKTSKRTVRGFNKERPMSTQSVADNQFFLPGE